MTKQLTLKNIEHFTLQQVFDKVARHLLKQRAQALDVNTVCMYRTTVNKGDKVKILTCAVGCLIPKRDYHKNMEGNSVGTILANEDYKFPRKFLLEDNLEYLRLLKALQNIHDAVQVEKWDCELQVIAEKFELKWIY